MKAISSISRRIVLGLFAVILFSVGARAAKPVELTPEQVTSIQNISDYINSFTDLQGDFTQISPKGKLSKGIFFISRPGKMRFEYAAPNPFLIVADGKWLTIKNRTKEKGDQYPLSETPLRLVLSQNVDLLKDTNILAFDEANGLTTVTLEDKEGTLGGNLILVFDQSHKALQQWIVVDGKGRQTTVSLENIVAGVTPDPKLFVVKIKRPPVNSNK